MKSQLMMVVIGLATVGLISAGCSGSKSAPDESPVEQAVEEVEQTVEEVEEEVEEAVEEEPDEGGAVVGTQAVAIVKNGDGEQIGEVRFTQLENGVEVEGSISGLEPGKHGFHVHEFGECEAPDFMSAGGHFNPGGHEHGAPDNAPEERHAGDFGNVEVDDDGVAQISFVDSVITLGGAMNDVIGQALIVHFDEDDLVSQPTGDAGGRAGCGLIEVIE